MIGGVAQIIAIIAEAPLRTVRRWMCVEWAAATGAEEIPRPLAALMDSITRRSHAHTWHWLEPAWGFFFLRYPQPLASTGTLTLILPLYPLTLTLCHVHVCT